MYLSLYEDNLTFGYDYYEKQYDFDQSTFEETAKSTINIVKKILTEKFIVLTTYSENLNATRVTDLYKPEEAKRIRRRNNFRTRSWSGTVDDDYPRED